VLQAEACKNESLKEKMLHEFRIHLEATSIFLPKDLDIKDFIDM